MNTTGPFIKKKKILKITLKIHFTKHFRCLCQIKSLFFIPPVFFSRSEPWPKNILDPPGSETLGMGMGMAQELTDK